MRAVRVLVAAVALTCMLAVPASAQVQIANPGSFTAGVVGCRAATEPACGGLIEFNGKHYGFAGGAVMGRVSRGARVSRGGASFGTAATDPAVDGPFQLTFEPVGVGAISGGFSLSGTPGGAADALGLQFAFRVGVYIRVAGGVPPGAAAANPGAMVGPSCTIATPSQALTARFVPTLASIFDTTGVPYDQAHGTAYLTARLNLPGVQNCQGQEAAVDSQLGLPGPGSIAINIKFRPVIVSTAYAARHRHRGR